MTKGALLRIIVITLVSLVITFISLFRVGCPARTIISVATGIVWGLVCIAYLVYITVRAAKNNKKASARTLILLRALAIFSLTIIPFIAYDIIAKSDHTIQMKVVRLDGGDICYIRDGMEHQTSVSRALFNTVQGGDVLVIDKSRFFGLWKKVEILRHGANIGYIERNMDTRFYNILITLFLMSSLVFSDLALSVVPPIYMLAGVWVIACAASLLWLELIIWLIGYSWMFD